MRGRDGDPPVISPPPSGSACWWWGWCRPWSDPDVLRFLEETGMVVAGGVRGKKWLRSTFLRRRALKKDKKRARGARLGKRRVTGTSVKERAGGVGSWGRDGNKKQK